MGCEPLQLIHAILFVNEFMRNLALCCVFLAETFVRLLVLATNKRNYRKSPCVGSTSLKRLDNFVCNS